MHELSIAQNIIEIVRARIPEEELETILSVNVRVGTMSGVVPHSLQFCFDAIIAGTPLKNACIKIEPVPFVIRCRECAKESIAEFETAICPCCGSSETNILTGNELDVVEIVLDDVPVEQR